MRHTETHSIRLQDRDLAMLRCFFECRIMTTEHVASLYFEGRRESAKKRLQKLKSAGLLAERPRQQFECAVLYLTSDGLVTLRNNGVLELYPAFDIATLTRRARVSEMTLRHELTVMDLKVAFHVAALARDNLSIMEFTTWPLLNQFEALGGLIKPDAFVRIRERAENGTICEHSLYVELDRSTEPLDSLCLRARAYVAHYKSGRFAAHQGVPSTEYQKCPFRVLFVLRSDERRDNVARRLLAATPPILSFVWLGTLREIAAAPFDAVWNRPIDYRDSPFGKFSLRSGDVTPPAPACMGREGLVISQLPKRGLLD